MAYYATYQQDETGALQKVVINAGVGFVLPYYGETAPPGTLACDGSEISREAYSELFEVLGTKAGVGDGVSTFNLPDFRGKWLMGADTERAAGEEIAEGLPNITGAFATDCYTNEQVGAFRSYRTVWQSQHSAGSADTDSYRNDFDASRVSSIYGASAHVTPASVALLWCIIYE